MNRKLIWNIKFRKPSVARDYRRPSKTNSCQLPEQDITLICVFAWHGVLYHFVFSQIARDHRSFSLKINCC